MSGEKDNALLQLQLQQGRASLQAAATLGANIQSMTTVTAPVPITSAAVQSRHAAAQDRHVFRNTSKPDYTPEGPQPGAFAQPAQDAEVTSVPMPSAPLRQEADESTSSPRNEEPSPNHWWQKYPLFSSLDQQDFYCVLFGFFSLIVAVVTVGLVLGISNEESSSAGPASEPPVANASTPPRVTIRPTASSAPSFDPSMSPSSVPTVSSAPSFAPSSSPTHFPTVSTSPSSSPSQSSAPSSSPSNSPTLDISAARDFITALLPQQTVAAIQSDPNAPQARALEWAAMDYTLNTALPPWRIKQRFALATLFYATNGGQWKQNNFWLKHETAECNWYTQYTPSFLRTASSCQFEKRLEQFNLAGNNLVGTLPQELFLFLTNLKWLNFNHNDLRGPLPTQVGLLSNLERFAAMGNALTGQIPTQIGLMAKVSEISYRGNQLSGSIPSQIGRLSNMKTLRLNQNQLGNSIPTELGSCVNLKSIFLYENQLNGPIPSEMGLLNRLEYLSIPTNNLQSSIPSEMGLLGRLKFVELYQNDLTGTLPKELENWAELKSFDITDNAMSGVVPDGLCGVVHFDCNDSLCGCSCGCNPAGNETDVPAAGNGSHK